MGRQSKRVRFDAFEVDLDTGELRKHGIRIQVQQQPFAVLAALIEHPGELVTRESLRQRLWGDAVKVDFDHSLGTAVNKLREALNDSAETPRFVETLTKRGFRFVAPVEWIEPDAAPQTGQALALPPPAALPPEPRRRRKLWIVSVAAAICLPLAAWVWYGPDPRPPAAVRIAQITSNYRVFPGMLNIERFPGVASDGVRVFFSNFQDGRLGLAYSLVGGGAVHSFAVPPELLRPSVADISRDGTQLLIRSIPSPETEQALWIVPSTGGSARRLFDGLAHDAGWTADGTAVLFANGQDLYLIGRDGGTPRKLVTLPGRAYWIRSAPDGSAVRFTLVDTKTRTRSLWEVSPTGKNPHPLLPGWSNPALECCGNWTADGGYFLFQSTRNGAINIWGVRERRFFWQRRSVPFEITTGPLKFLAPAPSISGDRVMCIGANTRRELCHFDPASGRLEPYLQSIPDARRAEYAHLSRRLSWVSTADGTLWSGNEDGSERLQLTPAPLLVTMARWSPDDRRLAVMARVPGKPQTIYLVSPDGGALQPLLPEDRNQSDPTWDATGTAIAFGRLPDYAAEYSTPKDIHVIDLASKAVTVLPGSSGLFSPRWSPDGRYIAAMPLDQHRLMLFDRNTGKWSTLAEGAFNNPIWSRDGKYLYFQSLREDDLPVLRVSISDRQVERIFDRSLARTADSLEFWGLAPDGGPVGSLVFWMADVYGFRWNPGRNDAR